MFTLLLGMLAVQEIMILLVTASLIVLILVMVYKQGLKKGRLEGRRMQEMENNSQSSLNR